MKSYVAVFSKKINGNNGSSFYDYYGYRCTFNEEKNEIEFITTEFVEDDTVVKKAKSIKVKFAKQFLQKLELSFPIVVELDDEMLFEGVKSFYVGINKSKDGVVYKDKNGKRHLILVIRQPSQVWELPKKSYSLDDIEDFE